MPSIKGAEQLSARSWLLAWVERLDPDCFTFVMATGIVSDALYFLGERQISDALFAINVVAYPSLLAITLLRLMLFWRAIWTNFEDPQGAFAFFALIAGTDVLGAGLDLRGYGDLALWLWMGAAVLWLMLIYLSFGALAFCVRSRPRDILRGGWLLAIVATESLAILGTIATSHRGGWAAFFSAPVHALWAIGMALYAIYIALFFYRLFFFRVHPNDITPATWVTMGAAAICVNAGSTLLLPGSDATPVLNAMRPFILGATSCAWAWATWLIPLLALFGLWKHAIVGAPLVYVRLLWSLVFPLGMYAAATLRLSIVAELPALKSVAEVFGWIALTAWIVTALSGLRALSAFSPLRAGRSDKLL